MKEKVGISWSGGKDCALALFEILQSPVYTVSSLHTTFNNDTKRVGLHGIKQELIEAQAHAIGIPLEKIFIASAEDHSAYEIAMNQYYEILTGRGIKKIGFGDIFLEDLKAYRENTMSAHGLEAIFPLWQIDSETVAEKFITSGFKAIVCAADAKYFDKSDVGRDYDIEFIRSLPAAVDPCGENGEFHTFVYDGPLFKNPISVNRQHIETKEYAFNVNLPNGQTESRVSKFWFQELSSTSEVS